MSSTILPFRPRANAAPVNTECEADIIELPQPVAAEEETPFDELPPGPSDSIKYELYQPEQSGYVGVELVIPGYKLLPFLELLAPFITTEPPTAT